MIRILPPPGTSAAEWAVTRRVQVTRKYSCDITVGPGGSAVEWDPSMPRDLSPAAVRRYRAARDAVYEEVATRMGGTALVLDLEADGSLTPTVVPPR